MTGRVGGSAGVALVSLETTELAKPLNGNKRMAVTVAMAMPSVPVARRLPNLPRKDLQGLASLQRPPGVLQHVP